MESDLLSDSAEACPTSQLCEICQSRPKLYKCPRCSFFTCSLECCKRHKVSMDCNGKRDRTSFISSKDFNDSSLRNDFHFLEDILQIKHTAKRTHTVNFCGDKTEKRARSDKSRMAVSSTDLFMKSYQCLDSYSKGVKHLFHAVSA